MLYQKIIRPVLFRFDPEKVHNFFVGFGEFIGNIWLLRKFVSIFCGYKGRDISKKIDGLTYKTPFMLSAGFDYNGRLVNILPEISLGGVEVGSITAKPCSGNQTPRMTRLPKSKSIVVNKGLRNDGVEIIIKRLKKYKKRKDFIVGISIARTNDADAVSDKAGMEDYFYSFKRLNEENVGDYYAINISCPNAFGGESFTDPQMLQMLLSKLSSIECYRPVYIKMPINLEWSAFDGLLKIIKTFEMIKGVIIGNLNKNYDDLDYKDEAPKEYRGGLSGKSCFKISNELIKKTKIADGNRLTIIGCGGVMSAEDMVEKFRAGSDLVALITGMIYNGPRFIKELANEYEK